MSRPISQTYIGDNVMLLPMPKYRLTHVTKYHECIYRKTDIVNIADHLHVPNLYQ